jgi:hypothetical protein
VACPLTPGYTATCPGSIVASRASRWRYSVFLDRHATRKTRLLAWCGLVGVVCLGYGWSRKRCQSLHSSGSITALCGWASNER